MTIQTDGSTWRLSLGGIPVKILSREGVFEKEAAAAKEVYVIRAANLLTFITQAFPAPYQYLNTIYYPGDLSMPGFPQLRCRRISWKGFVDGRPVDPFGVDPTGIADGKTYEGDVELTIEYSTNPLNSGSPDPSNPLTFLEVSSQASGSFIPVPPRDAVWEGSNLPGSTEQDEANKDPNIPQSVPQPQVEWTVKWSQIPFGFWDATLMGRLRDALGKVNRDPMPIFGNAPNATILFSGWSFHQNYTWRTDRSGQPPGTLEMKFTEVNFTSVEGIAVTHQHLWRAGFGWRRLMFDGNFMFEEVGLSELFEP